MRLLAITLVAACVLGAYSIELPDATKKTIDRATKAVDRICVKSLGAAIDKVLGKNKRSIICGLNNFAQGLISPKSGCPNAVGNRNDVTVVLGLALNCTVAEGCQNQKSGVVKDVGQLLICILSSPNNVLSSVGQALQNVLSGLGQLPTTLLIVQFILYLVVAKLAELLCDPSVSILGIALVLPIVVSILLLGVAFGLIKSALAPVGLLVLGLFPVILLLIIIVSVLLALLSLLIDPLLLPGLKKILGEIFKTMLGYSACEGMSMGLQNVSLASLVQPPSITDIFDLLGSLGPPPPTFGSGDLFGGLTRGLGGGFGGGFPNLFG